MDNKKAGWKEFFSLKVRLPRVGKVRVPRLKLARAHQKQLKNKNPNQDGSDAFQQKDPSAVPQAFENLLDRYQGLLQQQPGAVGATRKTLEDAERQASFVKARAAQQAEVEAARIIGEAKQKARAALSDARQQAQEITAQEVRNILESAQQRAQVLEARTRQACHFYLLRTREDVQHYLDNEAKEAYYKLLSGLQDVMSSAQAIQDDWSGKAVEFWDRSPFQLEENYESTRV